MSYLIKVSTKNQFLPCGASMLGDVNLNFFFGMFNQNPTIALKLVFSIQKALPLAVSGADMLVFPHELEPHI